MRVRGAGLTSGLRVNAHNVSIKNKAAYPHLHGADAAACGRFCFAGLSSAQEACCGGS